MGSVKLKILITVNTRAIWNVTSDELLTKQAMKKIVFTRNA
jgi:hypothetical protein